jgi:ferredoxin
MTPMLRGTDELQTDKGSAVSEDQRFSIVIDDAACVGHGRCFDLHPDMFTHDEEGMPVLLAESFAAEQRGAAQEAVNECPERALSLQDQP